MRWFRRKNKEKKEELEVKEEVQEKKVSPEVKKMVEALKTKLNNQEAQINNQEAQITTFKQDIAPQMAETIQDLKDRITRLNKRIEEKDQELLNQQQMIRKISSGSEKLQKEGATEILIKSQNEVRVYKNQVLQQSEVIVDLQKKVNLLPTICTRLVDEINKRNLSIQKLINQIEAIKAENVKLSLDSLELEKRLEEALRDFEEKEFKTKELLSSVSF